MWLTAGTGTPAGPAGDDPSNPGPYGVEQAVWQSNQSFKLGVAQSATPFRDLSYLGGEHTWAYGQWSLHRVLPELVAAIAPPAGRHRDQQPAV